MKPSVIIALGSSLILLAGCASEASTVATDTTTATGYVATGTTYANEALAIAEASLAVYRASPNPSPKVLAEAAKLDAEARAAITQYGPEASQAIAMAGALAEYLLTSAPGNGQTPTSEPVT